MTNFTSEGQPTMDLPPRILMFGSDHSLIETRRWVLERSGFLVRCTLDLGRVREILDTGDVDILLLCHSLSPGDRESALALAHVLRPEMKKLVMEGLSSAFLSEPSVTRLDAFSDPRTLISTVQELCGPRSLVMRDLRSVGEIGTGVVSQTH